MWLNKIRIFWYVVMNRSSKRDQIIEKYRKNQVEITKKQALKKQLEEFVIPQLPEKTDCSKRRGAASIGRAAEVNSAAYAGIRRI